MPYVFLDAELRAERGSNAVKWLRKSGKVPAVVYGKDVPDMSMAITIDARQFERLIAKNPLSTLIELRLDPPIICVVKDIQRHPIKRDPLHVDFMLVNMNEEQEFKVRVVLTGQAKGVREGGVLEQVLRSLDVLCLPANVPAQIEIDVSALGLDEHIAIKDIAVPEGVQIKADALQVICTLKQVVEKEASEEEGSAEPELVRQRKQEE